MPTDLTEIIRTAAQIKNETVENANTALRVGGCILDLAAFAAQGIFADEIAFESAADGVSVRLRYHNASGQPYDRRAFIPALNPEAGTAGVLTPAQYSSMKAFGAVYDVGVFAATSTAWNACAAAAVAGNSSYRVLKYTVGTDMYYIEQSVKGAETMQYLCEGSVRYTRYIRFSDANRTTVTEVQGWQRDGARNLGYTASTRVLQMKDMWGNNVGEATTLPEATTSAAGLLSATDKKKLNAYASTFAANPAATTSAAGLMTAADKKKLNACVTTDASYTERGLMTAEQVANLDNAMQRAEVGYFSAIETFAEGSNAVLETAATTSTAGTVVYCNRIGASAGASITSAGFAYKVGGKYYAFAPGAYPKPMPHRGGIAINTTDGHAYVLTAEGTLAKLLPVATSSTSGLMSSAVYSKLNTLEQQAANIHLIDLGTFDTMALAENAAAALNVCSNPLFRHVFFTVGRNSFHLTQQVENDWCVQTLYMGKAVRQRYIHFSSADRTAIAEVQSWQDAMVRNLKYTASSQQLQLQSPWNDNVGSAATIPTVSSSAAGLAPKEWPARLAAMEQRIATLENKVQALEAAAASTTAEEV